MTVVNDSNVYLPSVVTTPSSLEITDITREQQMQITTTMTSDQANTYVVNMVVNLTVPESKGLNIPAANPILSMVKAIPDNDLVTNNNNIDGI